MLTTPSPRCSECALPLHVVEPFTDSVAHALCCPGCGVRLIVRRVPNAWTICTFPEAKQQRTAPLPAVARRAGYNLHRMLRCALAVLRPAAGVLPGEAAFPQLPARAPQAPRLQGGPVEQSFAVVHDAVSGGESDTDGSVAALCAATGKRAQGVA